YPFERSLGQRRQAAWIRIEKQLVQLVAQCRDGIGAWNRKLDAEPFRERLTLFGFGHARKTDLFVRRSRLRQEGRIGGQYIRARGVLEDRRSAHRRRVRL